MKKEKAKKAPEITEEKAALQENGAAAPEEKAAEAPAAEKSAGGPPPWATGDGPPPWATGDGPPPWATGDGPPPWATGDGPPPWATGNGPPPWATGNGPPPWARKGKKRSFWQGKETEKEIDLTGKPPENIPVATFRGGSIPEEMKKVAPDFIKWNRQLLFMNIIFALSVLITELVFSIVFYKKGLYEESFSEHLTDFMIIPSIINFAAVAFQAFVFKFFKDKELFQSIAILLTQTIICTVLASVHYKFPIMMGVFWIPIMTSVNYFYKKLTFATIALSVVGIVIATAYRFAWGLDVNEFIIPGAVLAVITVVFAYALAKLTSSLMSEQKMKLINAFAEAKRSQAEALVANSAKSEFLANMSHEIRTPINAILGMNEMILREERTPSIRGYSSNIQTYGNALLSIINDVLDISKIEAGKIEITPFTYEVSSLVNDCCNILAARAREKHLELEINCAEDIPRSLLGDEPRIRQIIVNLLTNAVKYTEKGTVTLTVDCERKEDKSCILKVSVRDTGIGISKEDLSKLFTQFKRFDMARNRSIEGTGLGLTIVKHFVDLMNGTIDVRSELDLGSIFTVTIPQEIVDETPCGKITINFTNPETAEYKRSFEAPNAYILAVDDLQVNLMVITNMLKDTKIKIDTATSGKDAIELCKNNKYDLILMDHMMPEMDGIETNSVIRSDKDSLNRETPVIMLTANAIAGMRDLYLMEGFADYLTKPVRGQKLEEMIQKHLPPELVYTGAPTETDYTAAEEAPAAPAQENSEVAELLEALPQLNMKLALPYCCDSMELFMSILQDYASNTRFDDMQKYFEAEQFDDYRREAHSLKSTSLTIGLDGLSERARASEFALKNGDTELCKNLHTDLMDMYGDALGKIREFLKNKESA